MVKDYRSKEVGLGLRRASEDSGDLTFAGGRAPRGSLWDCDRRCCQQGHGLNCLGPVRGQRAARKSAGLETETRGPDSGSPYKAVRP